MKSDMLVVNKIELAEYVNVDLDQMRRDTRQNRGQLPFIFGSMRKGIGISELVDFLKIEGFGRIDLISTKNSYICFILLFGVNLKSCFFCFVPIFKKTCEIKIIIDMYKCIRIYEFELKLHGNLSY